MHLVFLNQYYPPDAAPTGVVLRDLAEVMVLNGHRVTVLCAEGGYADGQKLKAENPKAEISQEDDSRLVQNPTFKVQESLPPRPTMLRIGATRFGRGAFVGKLLDYASYYLGVTWKLLTLHPRPERIVALTTPPYLSVLARAVSKLCGADHGHWVMDLYPDVMVAHGMIRDRSLGHRVLAGLTRWGFNGRRCAAIVTLGPDMAVRIETLISKGQGSRGKPFNVQPSTSNTNPVSWMPLWSGVEVGREDKAGEQSDELRKQRGWRDDEMIVMYSGNMGLGHRFGEILAAAQEWSTESDGKVRFAFFGGGRRRNEVQQFMSEHPDCPVEIHDYAPAECLHSHLQSADVHLVSLDAEWTGTMVPSKLQGIFAAARPVVFIGGDASSIAGWVRESGAGWVVAPGDLAGLLAALAEARDPAVRARLGTAALAYANKHFDKRSNANAVANLFEGRSPQNHAKV